MQNNSLKLIVVLLYSLFVSFVKELEYYYILPLLPLLYIEYINIKVIFKKIAILNFFVLFLVIFVAFNNIFLAIELFFRVNLILLFTVVLFTSSSYFDIVRGLSNLKIPPLLVSLFYFTIVMIVFLEQEIINIKNSLKARGFKNNTSLFTYKTFGNIFGMLFVKSLIKSKELQQSMLSRGFNGNIFLISNNKIVFFDILVIFLTLFIIVLKLV